MVSIYICVPCRVHLAAAVPTIWPGTRHPTGGYRQKGTEESRFAGVGVHNGSYYCESQGRIVCSVRVFGLLRCDSHCYGYAGERGPREDANDNEVSDMSNPSEVVETIPWEIE
ncbi:hypothetical protein CDEST_08367 [Colletotrichum destructivum]|uniref:Uncharacterized protein n=1 Tax=Colletotrichum destructivum TaxID=34406 RepID=A0AAX4IK06_9PEZI|nr:hypothetical protein CDEST_08367 [Colletotrichum destructivum]